MAQDCTLTGLLDGSKCFNALSKTEKQAALVYFLALGVKADGGPDLTDANALATAIKCLRDVNQFQRDSFDVLIAQRLATAAGDTSAAGLSISQLRAAIKCYTCMDPIAMRAAETHLRCLLNDYIT